MSDLNLDPIDDSQVLDPHVRAALKQRNELAERARAGDAATARVAELEREAAFRDAGIPSTPLADMFVGGYTGELTKEAILAKAKEVGLPISTETTAGTETTTTTTGDPNVNAELAALRGANAATGSGAPAGAVRLEDAIERAQSQDEVMEIIRNVPADARDANGRQIIAVGAP